MFRTFPRSLVANGTAVSFQLMLCDGMRWRHLASLKFRRGPLLCSAEGHLRPYLAAHRHPELRFEGPSGVLARQDEEHARSWLSSASSAFVCTCVHVVVHLDVDPHRSCVCGSRLAMTGINTGAGVQVRRPPIVLRWSSIADPSASHLPCRALAAPPLQAAGRTCLCRGCPSALIRRLAQRRSPPKCGWEYDRRRRDGDLQACPPAPGSTSFRARRDRMGQVLSVRCARNGPL